MLKFSIKNLIETESSSSELNSEDKQPNGSINKSCHQNGGKSSMGNKQQRVANFSTTTSFDSMPQATAATFSPQIYSPASTTSTTSSHHSSLNGTTTTTNGGLLFMQKFQLCQQYQLLFSRLQQQSGFFDNRAINPFQSMLFNNLGYDVNSRAFLESLLNPPAQNLADVYNGSQQQVTAERQIETSPKGEENRKTVNKSKRKSDNNELKTSGVKQIKLEKPEIKEELIVEKKLESSEAMSNEEAGLKESAASAALKGKTYPCTECGKVCEI